MFLVDKLKPFCIALLLLVMPQTSASALGGPTPLLHLGPGVVTSLAWRPDGSLLAVGTRQGIRLYDAQFNPMETLLLPAGNWDVIWNADGNRLAAVSDQPCALQIWEFSGNTSQQPVLSDHYGLCGKLRWSHSRNRFALLSDQGLLTLIDKAAVYPVLSLVYSVTDFNWQSQGQQLAFTTANGTLSIWDAAQRRITWQIRDAGQHVEWSPDDSQLATVIISGDKTIPNSSVESGTIHTRRFNAIRIWNASTAKMTNQVIINDDLLTVEDIHWLPQGLIAGYCYSFDADFYADQLCLWDMTTGKMLTTDLLGGGDSSSSNVVWSPDRLWFYAFLYWQTIKLEIGRVGVSDLAFVPDFEERSFSVYQVAWTPDSRFLTIVEGNGNVYQFLAENLVFF